MTESRSQQVDLAGLAAAIERAAADLALAEEPSRFIAALEEAADEEERPWRTGPSRSSPAPSGRARSRRWRRRRHVSPGARGWMVGGAPSSQQIPGARSGPR